MKLVCTDKRIRSEFQLNAGVDNAYKIKYEITFDTRYSFLDVNMVSMALDFHEKDTAMLTLSTYDKSVYDSYVIHQSYEFKLN